LNIEIDTNTDKDKNIKGNYNNYIIFTNLENKEDINFFIGEGDRLKYLEKEEAKDMRKFPLEKYAIIIFFYILMILINLLKGTEKFESIINIKK
jgi:hypothetical protein